MHFVGKWLYCAGEDNTLYVFDMQTGKLEDLVPLNISGEVLQLVHHPQRNMLAIITSSGEVMLLVAK